MATDKVVGNQPTVVDNLLPKDIALKAENIGVIKANLDWYTLMMLSIMAGAFIALGSAFFTTVITGNGAGGAIKLPGGILRLVGGLVFCLGLILVVIAGAELFTGNVLIIMAAASKKISASRVLRNWGIVYVGNFIGSIITAWLIYNSGQFKLMDGLLSL
ncbi:formate/nitrite transporter [Candidatus Magnetobacterium bavaricum]|uniref:Formate/nitrite transporter n=1 Tax=Candidatus Magnetobacterium bavaricum TaxID=29290 RepID=A0A0F3GRY2_9BACT|nr:formate/nitrite transporter [Candidatus Magnetobacterium bavaricum]